jgi:low temperature requirement protein LtrA
VLGESVLAIGVGLSSGAERIGTAQIGFAAVSLTLAAALFWAYFGTGEDHAAELALEAAPEERQQPIGLASFGYAFAVMLLGIVFAASGLHHALEHPTHHLDLAWAAQLAAGTAGFWVGLASSGSRSAVVTSRYGSGAGAPRSRGTGRHRGLRPGRAGRPRSGSVAILLVDRGA